MLTLYKWITASLAIAGSLSLLITGELNPVFIFPGLLMFPGYYRYIKGRPPVSRWLIAGLAVLEIGVLAFDMIFVSSDFLIAIAHMTIVFQALKSFDMREPWDPLQVYFMSILQIVITSELSLSILVGVFFGVFLVLFMAAMIFSHFMKEGTLHTVRFFRPVSAITFGALLLTLVLFISIPRVSGSIWGRKASGSLKSVGFSENVELGSFGRVLEDPSIVMRAEIEGPELPLYWRGSTLNRFDGTSWKNTIYRKDRIFKRDGRFTLNDTIEESSESVTLQRIILEPLDTEVVFGLGEITSIEAKGWVLFRSPSGSVSFAGTNNRRISYTVHSVRDTGNRDVRIRRMHLQLPDRMEKVRALTEEITQGATSDIQKANAILSYLSSGFTYTLSPRAIKGDFTPIDWFLFESREGYCEHFSTAMALMLRTQGIPSRIVTGFLGGDRNDNGNYVIVRQRDAHSWVEAAIDGKWRRFDPTPVSRSAQESAALLFLDNLRMNWYRYVIGFSSYDQISMLSSLTLPMFSTPDIRGIRINISPLYLVSGLLVASLSIYVLTRRRSSGTVNASYSTKAYASLRKQLKKKGAVIKNSTTPDELVDQASRVNADTEKVRKVTDLYTSNRFGGIELTEDDIQTLRDISRNPF